MNNKEWQALLLKYRKGQCTKEELLRIHRWYDNLRADGLAVLSDQEKHEMENRMLSRLAAEMTDPEQHALGSGAIGTSTLGTPVAGTPAAGPPAAETPAAGTPAAGMPAAGTPAAEYAEAAVGRNWWQRASVYWATAAAVLLAIGFWAFLGKGSRRPGIAEEKMFVQAPGSQLITEENTTNVSKRLTLSDRSTVTLEPGARIVFPAAFTGDKRTVQLTGNAFFEITRNPDQPFLVYSGKLITRVLGTSFRIKSNAKHQALEVEVVTGKVSVFENKEAFNGNDPVDNQDNGVVLTPNQRVTYFAESRHLMTGLVPEPVKASPAAEEARMVFNDEKLEKIAAALQETYGIEIVFANDRIAHCTFTGDLTDMQLYDKLALVCKSNGADYEVKGTRILINGRGCD